MEILKETENVTFQEILELASWNQPRSTAQLRTFVAEHDAALDVEDFAI